MSAWSSCISIGDQTCIDETYLQYFSLSSNVWYFSLGFCHFFYMELFFFFSLYDHITNVLFFSASSFKV